MAIPKNLNFPNQHQIPDHSIMDFYNKQAYLGNQFISGPDTFALADASEHPILYVLCPSTSAKSIFIHDLNLGAAVSTDVVTFRIYSNPTTVTSGTAITPVNVRPASSTTSIATAKYGVAAVSKGARMETIVAVLNTQVGKAPIFILDPGQSLLITGQAAVTATAICEAIHYEM